MPCTADIGRRFGPCRTLVTRERLLRFAEAIGEDRPIYRDFSAARAAGHRDILATPTFLFCAMLMDASRPLGYLEDLGVDLNSILHAEQAFRFHRSVCAGDTLTFMTVIKDVSAKPEKGLIFLIDITEMINGERELVAVLERNVAVKSP